MKKLFALLLMLTVSIGSWAYNEEFGDAKRSNNLTNEDLLISSLISLAPKKVFIQLTSENYNQKILKTIMQIFENKTFIVDSTPILEVVR
jgi:hypothetical protein